MNKYILRTSLVWFTILAIMAGVFLYRSHLAKQQSSMGQRMPMPTSGDVQPAAAGPVPSTAEAMPAMSDQKMDAPLVPIQLTPERMLRTPE
jgi:hypothetical protein